MFYKIFWSLYKKWWRIFNLNWSFVNNFNLWGLDISVWTTTHEHWNRHHFAFVFVLEWSFLQDQPVTDLENEKKRRSSTLTRNFLHFFYQYTLTAKFLARQNFSIIKRVLQFTKIGLLQKKSVHRGKGGGWW